MKFDNFFQKLKKDLLLESSEFDTLIEADICTGYFNLGGWQLIEQFLTLEWFQRGTCRLLVGKDYKKGYKNLYEHILWNLSSANRKKALSVFLEALEQKRLIIKYDNNNQIHAKIYLFKRSDLGSSENFFYTGSSNLTKTGLTSDGEFNQRFNNHDETQDFVSQFESYWNCSSCINCSNWLQSLAAAELFGLKHFSFKDEYEWREIPIEVYWFAKNTLMNMDGYLTGASYLDLYADFIYDDNWEPTPPIKVSVLNYPYWKEIERLMEKDENLFQRYGAKDYLIESEYIDEEVKIVILKMNGSCLDEAEFDYNIHRIINKENS